MTMLQAIEKVASREGLSLLVWADWTRAEKMARNEFPEVFSPVPDPATVNKNETAKVAGAQSGRDLLSLRAVKEAARMQNLDLGKRSDFDEAEKIVCGWRDNGFVLR